MTEHLDGDSGITGANLRVIVTPDASEVRVVDYTPPAEGGEPLTEERVARILKNAGVAAAPDPEGMRTLLARVAASEPVSGLVLARSTPPADGEDGTVHFKVRMAADIGELGSDDRVNYHERGIVTSVSAGQVIAVLTPPTSGSPGRDVKGGPIPARSGLPAELRVGDGVSLSADGTSAVATASGMVQFARGMLSVNDSFEVAGDVDFSTGNIRMERGSVIVRGVVRDGFEIAASGNVVVQKEVEAATIVSGGDVEVRHGVLAGRIKAEGTICAQFAVNATLAAGGDIVVANNLYTCDVTAGGRIVASSGKGVVRGGVLRCVRGIEVNELGSVSESQTEIVIDTDKEEERSVIVELAEIEESLELVYQHLGDRESLSAEPVAGAEGERLGWERVQENLRALLERQADLKDRLWRIRREKQRELRATVTVKRVIYPGVVVRMGGLTFAPTRPIERCALFYDLLTDQITSTPL